MVISDSLQNANVTFTRRKVWTYTSGDARQREGTEEKQVYQLRKNDGYEAVMCQVDRFFLLLTSFARHILGDDDNAFVHCIKCTELHPRCRGSGSRLSAKLRRRIRNHSIRGRDRFLDQIMEKSSNRQSNFYAIDIINN